MFRKMGIAWRMALLVLFGAGIIMGSIVGYSYFHARGMLEEEIQQKALYLAQATANRIETVENAVEKMASGLAMSLEYYPASSKIDFYRLLEHMVRENPEISGSAVAFASKKAGTLLPAPYVYRVDGSFARKDLGAGGYRYDIWDWYTLPKELKKPIWSEPYFDEGGGNMLMVTYSVPLFDSKGLFEGVVTCDVSLEWLTGFLRTLPIGKTGYATLTSRNGTYIAHPRREFIMRESVFSLAEERGNPALRRLGQRTQRGETGIVPFESLITGKPGWLAFAPIPSTGWSLGVIFPRAEAMAKVMSFTRDELLLGLVGFTLLLLVVLAIARSITQPLRQLDKAVRSLDMTVEVGGKSKPKQLLATGNLEIPEIRGEDEVARLSASFARMRRDLKEYIEKLQAATVARERIESDLRVAETIQRSLIPKDFPKREDFEIRGLLDPAREVGGDFYDFFLADPEHLCLAIGDVSGKGVPTALFMAVTRTFLKAFFREDKNPAASLSRLNDELEAENDSNMFVTLFCAVIDLKTGECRYANGGHNPPVLLRGGSSEFLPKVRGALVGCMKGIAFDEGRLMLKKGDRLFLYTDGVTEAMDKGDVPYGETGMLEALAGLENADCAELLKGVRASIKGFVKEAEQSDDITMLAFRFFP
ncbi:MAG TPA: serine/threonine protein phosphatase [Cyanobacteria bacterium UBA8530]|nr:serine/threonine protein phosphatase [Cyanobacteria bacterium UBA8530]